jgi:predicted Na+-dependent transporter
MAGLSATFMISFILSLIITYFIYKMYPEGNKVVLIILVPTFLTFLLYSTMSAIFPTVNEYYEKVSDYGTSTVTRNMNSMGFYQIYPPVLFVLLLFVIFLYQRRMG